MLTVDNIRCVEASTRHKRDRSRSRALACTDGKSRRIVWALRDLSQHQSQHRLRTRAESSPPPPSIFIVFYVYIKKKRAFLIIPHHSHPYVNTPSKTFISESVSSCLDLKQINFSFLAVGMSWVIITGNRSLCCQGPTWDLGEVALATSVLTFKSILRVT